MEVVFKYKQSEVGEIPEDWNAVHVKDVVLDMLQGINTAIDKPEYADSGIPMLKANNIIDQRVRFEGVDHVTLSCYENYSERFKLKVNDFLFSNIGARLGTGSLLQTETKCTFAWNVMRIVPNTKKIVPQYLSSIINSPMISNGIKGSQSGSGMGFVPKGILQSVYIPLPPTLDEQQAIAEALSDADVYIECLEKLIAKKRLIKQGAMQELMKEQSDDIILKLKEVSTLKGRIGWQGLKQSEFTWNEDDPYLITGMNFKEGSIRWNEVYHISETRYDIAPEIQLKQGDVLMTKDGTIGKILYIDSIPYPNKASLNSHLLLFRPIRNSYYPKYLFYQLNSQRFGRFIEMNKYGTTFFGISQAIVGEYPVLLPSVGTQKRIGTILWDMDEEIKDLEEKLNKVRQIKQGMMQELLTGRIRLV